MKLFVSPGQVNAHGLCRVCGRHVQLRCLQNFDFFRFGFLDAHERGVTEFAAARPFVPHEVEGNERSPKKPTKPADYKRGEPEKALGEAAVRVEATYTQPAETHNPMEPHATIAVWDGPNLTLYDKTTMGDTQQSKDRFITEVYDEVKGLPPVVDGKRVPSP